MYTAPNNVELSNVGIFTVASLTVPRNGIYRILPSYYSEPSNATYGSAHETFYNINGGTDNLIGLGYVNGTSATNASAVGISTKVLTLSAADVVNLRSRAANLSGSIRVTVYNI
jgi:hypothetical protein